MSNLLKLKKSVALDFLKQLCVYKQNESMHFKYVPDGSNLLGFKLSNEGVKYKLNTFLPFTEGISNENIDGSIDCVNIGVNGLKSDSKYVDD